MNFKNGIHIEEGVFSIEEISQLRIAFYEVLGICDFYKKKAEIKNGMDNTVHHILFMNKIYCEMIAKPINKKNIDLFFGNKKYILNSFGGNNNTRMNYANNIHRDVRFYTLDRLMLNSIWCISPLNKNTGGTQMLLGSNLSENAPSLKDFERSCISINAPEGSIIYFDSRVWHRAGNPIEGLNERIIYTPIYSRPFIKPGFNYSLAYQSSDYFNISSDFISQICSYYSDIPNNHTEWYGFNKRRFYLKEQDQ